MSEQRNPAPGSAPPPGLGWFERQSRWVLWVYWVCLLAGTHRPKFSQDPPEPPGPFDAVLQLDKLMHFTGFGGLMVLLVVSGLAGRGRSWAVRCRIALVIALCFAGIDEYTQVFVIGRDFQLTDLLANALGIVWVYILALLPSRQAGKKRGWPVVMALLLLLALLLALTLSPWVMHQLEVIARETIPHSITRNYRLDHIGHGLIALFVSIILIVAWPMASRRPRRNAAVTLLALLLAGPMVEVAQHYSGRGVEGADVLGHSIGVGIAMLWWALQLTRSPALCRSSEAWLTCSAMAPSAPAAPADAPPVESVSPGAPRFVGHAVLVSVLTLLSRFAGLGRDAVLAAVLGLSVAADAFFIGFLVPNLFRRLFGEGALTAAFIPSYTDLLARDPALAKRFASLTLTLLTLLLAGITLAGELALWRVAGGLEPGGKTALAVHYTRIMLPYMPLICMVALIGGVLQVHKRFGPPAAAPLVLNGVLIAAVLFSTSAFSIDTPERAVASDVAVAVLIAGVLQLAWQLTVMLRVTGLTRSFVGCGPTMKSMLIMMGPMVVGLAVFQINALLDALIAFFFAPQHAGAGEQLTLFGQSFTAPLRNGDVAAINWSQRLYQFPLGVFGIAIATAIFPALASAAARFSDNRDEKNNNGASIDRRAKPQPASEEFAAIVRQGMRLTVFIGLPASAGLILVRIPLARTVFEHGGFTTDDALRVSTILAGYASSVWAYSMTHTLTRAFYALKDATTPLKVSACMVTLNLALNLSLIWPLGAAGLAWSTAISAAGQVGLLLWLISRRVDRPIDASVTASWGRTALSSVAMVGLLLPITLVVKPAELAWSQSAGLLAGLVVLGAAVVLLVAWVSDAEELRWLRRRSVK